MKPILKNTAHTVRVSEPQRDLCPAPNCEWAALRGETRGAEGGAADPDRVILTREVRQKPFTEILVRVHVCALREAAVIWDCCYYLQNEWNSGNRKRE